MTTRQQKSKYRGRNAEYRLAKKVNGVVVGRSKAVVVGDKTIIINPQLPPDVVTAMFSFESKWLSHVPANISKVMTQATTNAPKGLVPVGVVGDRLARQVYYILMEQDFIDLHIGDAPKTK